MRSKIAQRILDETPKDVEIFVRLYSDITVRINQILKQKNMTQKDLADLLEKKPSEINKWLKGEHNFTLRSIAKLQAELGEELIYVPKKKPVGSTIHGKTHMTVYRNVNYNDKRSFDTVKFKQKNQFANVG